MSEEIRDMLEAAIDQHADDDSQNAPAPAPAPAPVAADVPAPAPAPTVSAPAPAAPDTPAGTPAPAAATPPVEVSTPPPAPVNVIDKAPGTWNPQTREKWQTIDPAIREEIWKRERDMNRAFTMSADARKFQQQFHDTIQPFMGFIAAENSTPIAAVQNLMQTAAILRVGTPQQKANTVAQVIKQFGIDIEMLDSMLAGQFQAKSDPVNQVQQIIDQRLNQFRTDMQRGQEESITASAKSEFEAFANDPKNEFFEDVRGVMADLITVAAQNGQALSLTDAYQRAIMLVDPVRQVVEQRKQAELAKGLNQQVATKRNAASSVTSSAPVVAQSSTIPNGADIRSFIEQAFDQQQGR